MSDRQIQLYTRGYCVLMRYSSYPCFPLKFEHGKARKGQMGSSFVQSLDHQMLAENVVSCFVPASHFLYFQNTCTYVRSASSWEPLQASGSISLVNME